MGAHLTTTPEVRTADLIVVIDRTRKLRAMIYRQLGQSPWLVDVDEIVQALDALGREILEVEDVAYRLGQRSVREQLGPHGGPRHA